MAIVRIPSENNTLTDAADVRAFLAQRGIDFEQWVPDRPIAADAPAEDVLAAYGQAVTVLKARGGYVTADVIDVKPDTPNLDAMLAKFSREHWHDEDEVRFIIEGRGIFHMHPAAGPVFAIEVEAGDLIRVPRGTHHWFDLCADRRIRAIRLFQDPSGWTPHYTNSGVDQGFQPVCFGPNYLHERRAARVSDPRGGARRRAPARHRGDDHTDRVRDRRAVPVCARTTLCLPRTSRGELRGRPHRGSPEGGARSCASRRRARARLAR